MYNRKIINGKEFRQSTLAPRIWVSRDGEYIIPESKINPLEPRKGTPNYNKKGQLLQYQVCTTLDVEIDGQYYRGSKVFNVGRLVLDAWLDLRDDDLEVDHIDHNPENNNIDNLRLVTKSANQRNKRSYKPYWLYTPEVNAKRVETKKLMKEGLYEKPIREPSKKVKQDAKNYIYKNRYYDPTRKIEKMQKKIEMFIEKRNKWCRYNKNYWKWDDRVKELENKIKTLKKD